MTTTNDTQNWTLKNYHQALSEGWVDASVFYKQHVTNAKELDQQLHMFASLEERVIELQIDHLKMIKNKGEPLGRLFGVPIAVKDILDTIDFPTCYGSPIHDGRYSIGDAVVVRRLREQGAIIYGKTVTTEFATMTPAATRNPHNPEHTPGGSSSGSAAAVAAGVVPVALGSQTNGSVIRPASYCGVYAFKPSMGELPRSGMLEQSTSLDQIGLFARCIEDLALVGEIMSGDDGEDAASQGKSPRQWLSVATSKPPLDPKFCFVRTPWWDRMEPEAQEACNAFVELMDGVVEVVELPSVIEQTIKWHATVNDAEMLHSYYYEFHNRADALSPQLRKRLEAAQGISAVDYLLARERIPHVACAFDEIFDRYDAILTPAALGAAPKGLETTGDPIMQTVWTFAGLPVVGMPLLTAAGDMPLGVQAIGQAQRDGRLLRSCNWLVNTFLERASS
jgi:Asp-tRNA(Asn)/Glu-tRNA(Gln) amidotransferase A subunit family amidase